MGLRVFGTARGCGFRQHGAHLGVVHRTLPLEAEALDAATSSAPRYLWDSGLERSAPQFSPLQIGYDCPCLSPGVALRRYWVGSSIQTARYSQSKG